MANDSEEQATSSTGQMMSTRLLVSLENFSVDSNLTTWVDHCYREWL